MFKTDAIWTIAASLFAGLAQIITLSYLSHQIPLAALGALAMMNVCIYFATSLQDFGISSFQVQLTDSSPADHTVLLVLNMLQALLVATLLYVASPLIVSFYQMPQLASLLVGCCVLVFINGLYAVHQASLIKQLQLVSLAKVELISKVAGVGVTWYLILQQPTDLNAIIIGYICSALLKTLMLWLLKNDALKFATPVNLQLAGQAFRYGCWQFGSQQLSLIRAQSDQLIVGKILGMEVLGIYSLAREIIQYPARFTQPILQRLLLPRFANRTGDTVGDTVGDKKQLLYKSLQYSLWFNCFIYSMLALCSGLLVQILFPAQYAQVAVILCLLALGAVVRPNGQILVPYVQATGQVRRELVWNLVATFIWCGALLLTFMFFDILVGAVIISMLQILLSYSAFWYLTKQDLLPALKIICNMSFKPLAAALVCSLAGLGIVNLWF